uniref:Putative secreted protein n=1 Tax=Ixodes ricinus TaxID=34613 RepID=A0A6B0UC06_IXORI
MNVVLPPPWFVCGVVAWTAPRFVTAEVAAADVERERHVRRGRPIRRPIRQYDGRRRGFSTLSGATKTLAPQGHSGSSHVGLDGFVVHVFRAL